MKTFDYHKPERLADVMALIQVLALAEDTRRSEKAWVMICKDIRNPQKVGRSLHNATLSSFASAHPTQEVTRMFIEFRSSPGQLCPKEMRIIEKHYQAISLASCLILVWPNFSPRPG